MAALAPGQQLGHRFTLIRPLGEGGMGVVWLVEDHELEERVVVKLVPPAAPPEWMELLKRECRNSRRLVHPNIVRVYDLHQEGPHRFISMAHVEGDDIGQLRGQPLGAILPKVLPVADALDYAHREGVVHRDLKSSNVLLDANTEPRIVDFGIAGLLRARGENRLLGEEREPRTSDDIHGFGELLYEILSDRAEPLPDELASLLAVLLNRDDTDRLPTMGAVKEALRDAQRNLDAAAAHHSSKKAVAIAPPPRVARGEMIRLEVSGPMTTRALETSPSGVGWLTIATFVFLTVAVAAVFFLLPRWAPQPTVTVTAEVTDDVSPQSRTVSPAEGTFSLEHQAELKTRAEERREEALELRNALEQKRASRWGGAPYRSGSAAIETAEEELRARDYEAAAETYENALTAFHEVEARGQGILGDALADGAQALESGSSPAAIAAFELASTIDPGNAAAATGLSRARVLNDLVRLLAEGADQERRGDLALARESYRKAVSLDGYSQKARLALARAEGNLTEVAFRTAMSKAIEALNREDYPSARGFFEEAAKIKPGDSQVLRGIAQAGEGIRVQAIASHRESALRLEGQEEWHQAVKEYEAVLQLDPTIRFALEGKARSDGRAALVDRISYHIAHPERLSDEKVLTAAAALVEEADGIRAPGPRLQSQRAQLADLVRRASTAVPVLLESDNQTDVVVYQIGTLGRFVRHTLVVRPGTYTVVGSRPGYRDVRVVLRVEAGKEPQPLIVRCEEEI
ncbi:MAG: protein kinase domain-containing protein [Vicinamibacteria bacterium]